MKLVIIMTVYVDVLIFLNMIIDYFLLNLTSLITGYIIKVWRHVLTAFFASLFSLIIFIPHVGVFGELIIRFISAVLICLVGYGYKNFRIFIKNYFAFLAVSVIYNGLVSVVWMVLKPKGMIINNSVLYIDVSALEVVIFSGISYLIIRTVLFVIRRASPCAVRCNVKLQDNCKTIDIIGIVDTGNSLKDVYTGRHVIIADKSVAVQLFGELSEKRKILLPYKTVNGIETISAYPCKNVFVNNVEKGSVLVAVSDQELEGDYRAIVNPEILS